MNGFFLLELLIALGRGLLAQMKKGGVAQEVIDDFEAGLLKFETVHGTPVTKNQLDSLRITPQW